MSGTRARDWYASSADFLQLCGDAQSQAKHESEQEFSGQMRLKANQYGLETFISPKQLAWLCRLADHVEPKRLEPTVASGARGTTQQQEQSNAAEDAHTELYAATSTETKARKQYGDPDDPLPF